MEECFTSFVGLCYSIRWPSFRFDFFVKIWATCKNFGGNGFPRPPWQQIARTPMFKQVTDPNTSNPPFGRVLSISLSHKRSISLSTAAKGLFPFFAYRFSSFSITIIFFFFFRTNNCGFQLWFRIATDSVWAACARRILAVFGSAWVEFGCPSSKISDFFYEHCRQAESVVVI